MRAVFREASALANPTGGALHPLRIATAHGWPYDFRMPALIFWLLVIAAILFFKLTTKAERCEMAQSF